MCVRKIKIIQFVMFLPKNEAVLAMALKAWRGNGDLRERRNRYKQYTYGQQWNDPVVDENGKTITEGEFALRNGKKPMTNNLIRQLVKCVVGRFRNAIGEKIVTDDALGDVYRRNNLDELDSRLLEEFLISGCAIQRVVWEHRPHGSGVWVDNINPSRFFVNRFSDPRGWDIEMIGATHDMSIAEVIMRFAHGDRMRAMALRKLFASDEVAMGGGFLKAQPGRCRVIEVWTLESRETLLCHDPLNADMFSLSVSHRDVIDRENSRREKAGEPAVNSRWRIDTHWHCRYLAPDGSVLDSFESPYPHGSHPFVVKMYPLIDGEVHSFVEDVIDQQRYINRLIVMIDHIMSTSAKGALLFPANQRHESMSWEQIAREWSRSDSVIPYNPSAGNPGPQQISANNTNIGAFDLLSLEMKLFEEVSGVGSALMGKTTTGATGEALYESQVKNATIALADIFETFNHFRSERDLKASLSVV